MLDQGGVRFLENTFEIVHRKRFQLNPYGQASLEFGNQIRRFRQMKSARGDEQDVIGFYHAVFGRDGAPFNERQQIALHPFTRNIGAGDVAALGNFVDFINEYDAVLFGVRDRLLPDVFVADQAVGFFLGELDERVRDRHFLGGFFLLTEIFEHFAQLIAHFFHTRRGHHFEAGGRILAELDRDQFVVQLPAQDPFTVGSARRIDPALPFLVIAPGGLLLQRRDERVEHPLERRFAGFLFDLFARAFAFQLNGGFGEIADDRIHVAPDIADFGEFGRLDLDKRRLGKFRQPPGDFRFADAGRADHENVFRGDFTAQRFVDLASAPAAAQSIGHRAFGFLLADDMAVEFLDDFAWGHVQIAVFACMIHFRRPSIHR